MDVVLLGNLEYRLAFFGHDVSAVDLEVDHEKTCLPVWADATARATRWTPDALGPWSMSAHEEYNWNDISPLVNG
jgi:hypothetical protein